MIDLEKPVKTVSGKAVRIIAKDVKSKFPVIAIVTQTDGDETVEAYTNGGHYYLDKTASEYDLMNVPEERHIYFNLYGNGESFSYNSYRSSAAAFDREAAFGSARVRLTISDNKVSKVEVL